MSTTRDQILTVLRGAASEGIRLPALLDALEMPARDRVAIKELVAALVAEGAVVRLGRGRFALADFGGATPAQPQAVGRIRVHPAGYGFVEREDGAGDVFVPAKYRGTALDGDRVTLYTWEGFKGTEGRVESVLSRGRAKLTGIIEQVGRTFYLNPDDPRISTDFGRIGLEEGPGRARLGECVVVEITQYPTEAVAAMAGRVVRVLGEPDDPRTEIEKILVCADIPTEFPAAVLAEADESPTEVSSADLADRIDLRDRAFATIDPETARDFDDALCIEDGPHGGPRVWVAVADVSHYVRRDQALDSEAQIRGVSVYLPDRVVPMLPFPLSSGICSLLPDVDRCAMVVRLDFKDSGELVDRQFAAAMIRSKARLDYPGVAAALAGDFRGPREHYKKWSDSLERLYALAQTLRGRRRRLGTLEINVPEPKVILDEDDPLRVRDIVRSKGSEGVKGAYELVEEFMIAANEAVGAFFSDRELDTIWRIHAPPDESRIAELAELLDAFGIRVDIDAAQTPLGMSEVLDQVSRLPSARALSFLVLRSLQQAIYSTDNVGHFGLASTEYIHFTSPIRRYPDLVVHRLMKHQLHLEGQASGGAGQATISDRAQLDERAAASSSHERRAVEAEREAVSMYRAYLMRDRVGEKFDGRITGVTHFGVFVEFENPFVEGLIKIASLGDDFFDFDAERMQLSGRATGLTLALGDEVEVEILNVSVTLRRIELALVATRGRRRSSKRSTPREAAAGPPLKKKKMRGRSQSASSRAKARAEKGGGAGGKGAGGGGRAAGARPSGGRPSGGKPSGGKPSGGKPSGGRRRGAGKKGGGER